MVLLHWYTCIFILMIETQGQCSQVYTGERNRTFCCQGSRVTSVSKILIKKRLTASKKCSKAKQLQKHSLSSVHLYFCVKLLRCVSTHPNIFKVFLQNPLSLAVCVMCSCSKLSDLWASSLWFTSFQHLYRVQRLKAVKHRWQTLDLFTHFLHYNLRSFATK